MDTGLLLNAINDSTGLLLYTLDTELHFTSFTRSYREIMKKFMDADIEVGRSILEYLTNEDAIQARMNYDRVLRGEIFSSVQHAEKPGLNKHYWESRYTPMYADGKQIGITVFLIDVSDRMNALKEARDAQTRLNLALKASQTGVWEWNIQTDEIYWSDEVYALFDSAKRETPVSFEDYTRAVHPDDEKTVIAHIQESLTNRTEYNVEHRIFTVGDHQLKWVRGVGKVFSDANDQSLRMVGIVQDITRQKAEQEKNQQLALVANITTNMVIITSRNGQIEWVNPSFIEITGYTLEEVQGKKPGHVLQGPATDRNVVDYMNSKLLAGEGFHHVELINYTKAGKPYWTEIEVHPLLNEDGQVTKFVSVQSDITKQKVSQETLMENESRFRQIVQFSPMGLLMYELNDQDKLILIEINDAAKKMLGHNTSSKLGLSLEEAFPPLAETDIPNHYLIAARMGTPWFAEEVLYNDGKISGGFQVNAFHAGTNRVAVFFLDITERKKAEKEALDWRTRYELIVKSSGQMIYDYDVASDEILWSGSTQEILGYTNEEMGNLGQWSSLIHPDDRDRIISLLTEARQHLEKFNVEYRFLDRWGNYKVLHDRGFFFRDKNHNNLIRMLGIMEDITGLKEAEKNLLQKNDELLKANEELDRFVYSASHDLRAPIASLLGLIQVARFEDSRDSLEMLFTLQEKSLRKLDSFIRDIVDHSRNARMPVDAQTIDVQRIIQDAFEQFNYMENSQHIRKEILLQQNCPFVNDAKRFQIIINNLISNAIKYADLAKEDPHLLINSVIDEHEARFIFTDNGEGISDDHRNRIFDMFFRASARGAGSGLGLYIVKETVDKLNGTITVESRFGKGSTFTVLLSNSKSTA
jgi:PAS domain S-box-containing protein